MKPVWSFDLPDHFAFEVYNQVPDFAFLQVEQIHSNLVAQSSELPCQADAIIMAKSNFQTLAIKTADCLPIALYGQNDVALIHAGWRGLQSGILQNPKLKKMAPTVAVIGPSIHQKNYQVGDDLYKQFQCKDYFRPDGEKWLFHLGFLAQTELRSLNQQMLVVHSPLDTFESPNLHSYRKNKTGERNYNVLRKKV